MGVQGRNLNAVETGAVALGYLLSGLWCESPSFHLLAPVLLCFLLTCCLPNIDALIYSTHLHYIALPFLYIFFSPMSNRDSVHTFSLDWVENPVIVLTERPFNKGETDLWMSPGHQSLFGPSHLSVKELSLHLCDKTHIV